MIATIRWVALCTATSLFIAFGAGIASSAEGDSDVAAPPDESDIGIDEIVVTTRKRDEKTQELPASITAFDASMLEELGVTNAAELTKFVPNLKFDTIAASSNTAQVFIRGIGQADGIINAEQGVGIYVNGVYQARSLGSILSLGDIERIEVLRGPQGALYGKNAIGGSIGFITKRPTSDYEASVAVTAGNYDTINTTTILNLPFRTGNFGDPGELVRSRFVFATESSDGWQKDLDTDDRWANNKNYIGRGTLDFLPADNLDITLRYEQSRQYERNSRPKCQLVPEREDTYFYQNVGTADPVATLGGNYLEECERSEEAGKNRVLTRMPNKNRLTTKSANATIDWTSPDVPWLGPIGIRGIGAWQRIDQNLNLELDATGLSTLESRVRDLKQEQWSGDLLFSVSPFEERLDLTLGLFYLEEDIDDPNGTTHVQAIVEQIAEVFAPEGQITEAQVEGETYLNHKTAAGFIQGVLDITEELTLTAGARYVYEEKEIDRFSFFEAIQRDGGNPAGDIPLTLPFSKISFGNIQAGPPYIIPGPYVYSSGKRDFDAWTGVVNLSYDFTDFLSEYVEPVNHAMIFAGWARGFRSGGFNYIAADSEADVEDVPPPDDCVPTPQQPCEAQRTKVQDFDPEHLNAFEVGLKTDWLDRRLRVNLTYFYDHHDDIQQRQTIVTDRAGFGTTNAVLNTGDAIFQGGEIEIEALPIPELYFRAGIGFIDAEYDGKVYFDDEDASREATEEADDGEVHIVQTDISDNDLIHVPPIDVSATVAYTEEIFDWGLATASFSWYMSGDLYFTLENKDALYQDRYHVFDARLMFDLYEMPLIPSTKARFELWAKNLTNERYLEGGINLINYHLRFYNHPRTFGGTVTLSFDSGM